jgi:hypothetical protein
VAAEVGKHLFAALLAEGIEALAVELQQRVALAIAQLVAADPAVVAIAIGGDAVEGEPGPPCASHDPAGHVVLGGGAAAAEQLQQLQQLVDGAHAHPLGDERAQAKEGSRGAGGHALQEGIPYQTLISSVLHKYVCGRLLDRP